MTYKLKIYGTHQADLIRGTNSDDIIRSGSGADEVFAGGGNDWVFGGRGDDVLDGGSGRDRLYGGSGDDALIGGYGSDRLFGGTGDDILTGDTANGSNGSYDRDVFNLGVVEGGDSGNDIITDFDTNNFRGGENNFDRLNFIFDHQYFSLSTGKDIVNFVNYIEHDGDTSTDAIRDGHDIIFIFERDSDGYAINSVRLENVIGDDGITNSRLEYASIDALTNLDFDALVYATDDAASVSNDAGAVSFESVLTNDSFDNGLGSVEVTSNVDRGALVFNADGTYSFDAGDDFDELGDGETAEVSFTYLVTDIDGDSSEATVTITVTGGDGINVINGTEDGDFIVGTDSADLINAVGGIDFIFGEGGDDILNGGDGNDALNGGEGADVLNGGDGIDFATYISSGTGVTVSLSSGTGVGGDAEGDTLNGIENLIGSRLDDVLTGDDGSNTLSGREGDDALNGGAGDDTLDGGEGADTLNGEGGSDTVTYFGSDAGVNIDLNAGTASGGDAEGDTLTGIENLLGSTFDDKLTGDDQDNTLNGSSGDDSLDGGAGADILAGGRGVDVVSYENSDDGVSVSLASGQATGGDAEGDRLSNIENLIGSDFNDVLTGSNGDNTLTGGAGDDTFVFTLNNGNDTITDFGHGQDRVDLTHFGIDDFDALKALLTDTGDDLVLALSEDETITFTGIENIDDLVADDFVL